MPARVANSLVFKDSFRNEKYNKQVGPFLLNTSLMPVIKITPSTSDTFRIREIIFQVHTFSLVFFSSKLHNVLLSRKQTAQSTYRYRYTQLLFTIFQNNAGQGEAGTDRNNMVSVDNINWNIPGKRHEFKFAQLIRS